MLHVASTLVLALVVAGVYYKRDTRRHLRLMIAAFVIDFSLVVYIEATRHAVEKIVQHASPLLWFHVAVSVAVLVAYVAQIQLGRRILAGFVATRALHLQLGLTFLVLRLANYVTSYLI